MSDKASSFEIVADRIVDPGLGFRDPKLLSALELWREKANGRAMPARGDFSHEDLWPFMGDVALIDIERNPLRYRFRLIGTNVADMVKRDMTGRYLDEIYSGENFYNAVRSFTHILKHRCPVRGTGNISHAEKSHLRVEVLDAPLSTNGADIDMILKVVSRSQ